MPPELASVVYLVGIVCLFRLDSHRDSESSMAMWIPVTWMSIGASRMVSQWFGLGGGATPDQLLDGSPVDRAIVSALLAAGLWVLLGRKRRLGSLLRANVPILVFLAFCAISAVWSDYPVVTFKRWTKTFGNMVMVAVVLTETDAAQATRRLLARSGFVLIPLSVLLVKYYPDLSRGYDPWDGALSYRGVTEGKNLLGINSVIFGLSSLWRCLEALRPGPLFLTDPPPRSAQLLAHGAVLFMALWLLLLADSAASHVSFVLGAGLLVALATLGPDRAKLVHLALGAVGVIAAACLLNPSAYESVVEFLGRDASLTGRTGLWADVIRLVQNPLLGAGFESFFLGDRLTQLWSQYRWRPNQAHNGYLETYLTLGWFGLALLGLVFVSGYRQIVHSIRYRLGLAPLRLALFVVALTINLTEAAFKVMGPAWISFILVAAKWPDASKGPERGERQPHRRPRRWPGQWSNTARSVRRRRL